MPRHQKPIEYDKKRGGRRQTTGNVVLIVLGLPFLSALVAYRRCCAGIGN